MSLRSTAKGTAKVCITVAIFVCLFVEFGGGPVPVSRAGVLAGQVFEKANPALPGIVGRIKARITGARLPPRTVPLAREELCRAAASGPVYVRTTAGAVKRLNATRHCRADEFVSVLASPDGPVVPLTAVGGDTVWMVSLGFQLVPMDMADLWREITALEIAVFIPWFFLAMAIKLAGIFANILRWQILLNGQGLRFGFGWLTVTYFVGRYWGIVTPSTMGLDAWRLYDTIRVSRRPLECTTAIVVERLIGLVGLLAVILMFMPFVNLGGRDLADLLSALKAPLAAAVVFGLLLLLRPVWFMPLIRFVPHAKVRGLLQRTVESITAYSADRKALALALACGVFGQLTTMLMYFCNAMALQVEGVTMAQVLYASGIMTLGTFLAPSASGEGVRELVFVALLGGRTTAAKAFLIGNLGFWIEKLPLSLPGGYFLLRAPEAYQRITQADLERLRVETMAAARPAR